MPNHQTFQAQRVAAFWLAAMSATACIPIPVTHYAQVTPAVTGTLLRSGGSPIVGARVTAADEPNAAACANAETLGVTDDRGAFHLPRREVRKRIAWLTMMESFGMTWYHVCVELGAPGEVQQVPGA